LTASGLHTIRIAFRAPWQNGVAERWICSLRSELLDRVVILNEAHARRLIADCVAYYNEDRCHLTLKKDPPEPRSVQQRPSPSAQAIAFPRVGVIHHRYEWCDAA